MRFIVVPKQGRWQWQMVDGETGQVFAEGDPEDTPRAARGAARLFRNAVSLAPIEMGT